MNKSPFVSLILIASVLFLSACGGGGSGSSENSDFLQFLIDENTPAVTGPGGTSSVGTAGALVDLGDLVAPDGDHWYYTQPAAINDSGIVVGQSNRGAPTKAAFSWDPATGAMTYLGIHGGIYEDFYGQLVVAPVADPTFFIYSEAVDINTLGDIIGNSTTGSGWPDEDQKRGFVWRDGTFIDLPPLPGDVIVDEEGVVTPELPLTAFSEAVDINEKGEVVLTAEDAEGRHAYFWDGVGTHTVTLPRDDGTTLDVVVAGPYRSLGRIVGADSEAIAINENGQAIINSAGTAVFHDLNWDVIETLNHLPGATNTAAVDINDSAYTNNDGIPDGHVIGNSGTGNLVFGEDTSVQGFFWDGGAMYPVDHLGGGSSFVTDINNSDQVVGAAFLAASEDGTTAPSHHAILWTLDPATKKGVIRDLGTLGGANSFATAINEAGQVTGWAETGALYEEEGVVLPVRHAFLWDNGVMYDLGVHNDFYDYPFIPSYPFSEGVAINAGGEVTGSSITINNHRRGFFLSPTLP